MNLQDLLTNGVAHIKQTGEPPASVASDFLSEHWHELSEPDVRKMAEAGLAAMLADEMYLDRRRQARQQVENQLAERLAERRREQERQKENEAAYKRRVKGLKAFHADVRRLHEQLGCCAPGYKSCQDRKTTSVTAMLQCIGGEKVVYLPPDEQKRHLDLLRAERQSTLETRQEVERIHDATHCNRVLCREGAYGQRARCVADRVLGGKALADVAKEDIEKRTKHEADFNDRMEQMETESHRRLGDIINAGMEYAYQTAIRDMESIMLIAADGTMKSLLDFNLDDVHGWGQRSSTNVVSWAKRKEFFSKAEAFLVESQADRIAALPSEKIQQLAREAQAIWKQDAESLADAV